VNSDVDDVYQDYSDGSANTAGITREGQVVLFQSGCIIGIDDELRDRGRGGGGWGDWLGIASC